MEKIGLESQSTIAKKKYPMKRKWHHNLEPQKEY